MNSHRQNHTFQFTEGPYDKNAPGTAKGYH